MRLERRRNTYSVPKRILKKLGVLTLVLGVPFIIFLFVFGVKKVEVIGAERYSNQEIRSMLLQSPADYNSLYLYLKNHFQKEVQIPFIEKLDMEMVGTHKIKVYVYEKMITGCIYYMGEYLYFDRDGILVETSPTEIEKVPVVKGLQYDYLILGKKIQVQDKDLFPIILGLTQLIHKYNLGVDTISFDKDDNVTLYCDDIKVLLGKKNDYQIDLADLKNILVKAKNKNLYELDMRNYDRDTGYVVGKTKKIEK